MQFERKIVKQWDDTCDVSYEHPEYPGFKAMVSETTREHVDLTLGRRCVGDSVFCLIENPEGKVVKSAVDFDHEKVPSFFQDHDDIGFYFKQDQIHNVLNFVTHQLSKLVEAK